MADGPSNTEIMGRIADILEHTRVDAETREKRAAKDADDRENLLKQSAKRDRIWLGFFVAIAISAAAGFAYIVPALEEEVELMNTVMTQMSEDMNSMRQSMTEMQTHMARMDANMARMAPDMNYMAGNVGRMGRDTTIMSRPFTWAPF